MKKTILTLTLALLFVFNSMAFASPLMDYSQGETSLDINWRPNLSVADKYTSAGGPLNGDFMPSAMNGGVDNLKGANRTFDWTVTTGLGNDFAVQYSQYRPVGKNSYGSEYGMSTKELNVLYQMDKHASAFIGYHRASFIGADYGNKKNTLQIGVVGHDQIADKTTLYGIVGIGNKLLNWEAGVAYEVAKNVEMNVSYRYTKVKEFKTNYNSGFSSDYSEDITAKGFGYGVTYKF